MANVTLAQSYVLKAQKRLQALALPFQLEAYSDVVREAQEIIGLAFFPARLQPNLPRLAEISKRLRRQRDFAFYGDEGFIPTAEDTRADAAQALGEAQKVVAAAQLIPPPEK